MGERLDRRDFLKVLATATAAGLSACSAPKSEKLIPYLVPPEEIVPGVAVWYKSVCRECPAGCGLLVRTREGRALKVEGNPEHPVNRGRLCVRGQAGVQGLYNPDRITQPLRRTAEGKLEPIPWADAEELLANLLRYLRFEKQADRVALLSHRVTGSLERLFADWMASLGSSRFLMYEPFAYEALRAANRLTFGTSEIPHYDLAKADVLLSFGADFLESWISNVGYAVDFGRMRQVEERRAALFVHIEPRQSLTAANADEWIAPKPDTEVFLVLAMVREIQARGWARVPASDAARIRTLVEPYAAEQAAVTDVPAERIRTLAKTFAQARPGLAIGGGIGATGKNAVATLVAINLLNYVCGDVGETVQFGRGTSFDRVATYQQMRELADAMRRDEVLLLLLHHVNPLYTMPAAAGFREALDHVPFKVSFSTFMDETTAMADLILPDHTPLERWEDYSPRAGVDGIAQPTMRPQFGSKATPDLLLSLSQKLGGDLAKKFPEADFFAYLKDSWKALHKQFAPQKDFEEFWRQAVESGGIWHEVPAKPVRLADSALRFNFPPPSAVLNKAPLYLGVYPSLQLFDGRGANRPWLQEVPEALSKIVWDSWVEIHPATATERGIAEGDLLELRTTAGSVQIPAHISEGIRRDTLSIPLGQGHTAFGRYAEGRGVNPMKLIPDNVDAAGGGLEWAAVPVEIKKLAVNRPLAKTQEIFEQHGRNLAQIITVAELLEASKAKEAPEGAALRMYAPHPHPEHRWGMAIDLNACIGCNACIAACYAENNVAVVGKEQVARGRHMAWIRIERYSERNGPAVTAPNHRFLVMLCQQCDSAPCESVCPVYATYHNPEGLNVQVYNRCVGTRYCGNNCPYKVRRFNWFDFEWPWPLELQLNPDLTVRSKGVMEKCTFCLQRIRAAKDNAKDEGRPVRDGEITPACAQSCPTEAIVFGDLKDPNSRVSRLRRDPRAYRVLEELNTEPAITYLKKVVRKA